MLMKGDIALARGTATARSRNTIRALSAEPRMATVLAQPRARQTGQRRSRRRVRRLRFRHLRRRRQRPRPRRPLLEPHHARGTTISVPPAPMRSGQSTSTRVSSGPSSASGSSCSGSGNGIARVRPIDAVLAIEPGNPTALFGRGVARRRSAIRRAMRIWIARGISTRASPIRSRIWACVPTRPAPPSRTSHARLRRQGLRPLSRGRARHWSRALRRACLRR